MRLRGHDLNVDHRAQEVVIALFCAVSVIVCGAAATLELVVLSKQIIALTREFEERHLNRKIYCGLNLSEDVCEEIVSTLKKMVNLNYTETSSFY